MTEGEHLELHTGASGKVLLAYAPKEVLEAMLSRGELEKVTPNTISDPAQLLREIKKVRRQGFAESTGEKTCPESLQPACVVSLAGTFYLVDIGSHVRQHKPTCRPHDRMSQFQNRNPFEWKFVFTAQLLLSPFILFILWEALPS